MNRKISSKNYFMKRLILTLVLSISVTIIFSQKEDFKMWQAPNGSIIAVKSEKFISNEDSLYLRLKYIKGGSQKREIMEFCHLKNKNDSIFCRIKHNGKSVGIINKQCKCILDNGNHFKHEGCSLGVFYNYNVGLLTRLVTDELTN